MCDYCKNTGEIETDNNGLTGPCPVCSSSRSPAGYARFRLRDKITVQVHEKRVGGKFIGIDSDDIITYITEDGEYHTAWDCNVYSA